MSKTMFDLDALRKAKQTYKSTQPIGASVGAVTGMKQPLPTGLPPVASKAASKVKVGTPSVTPAASSAAQKMVTATQPRTEQTLNDISSAVNTPFVYNAENDPAYQAEVKRSQQELAVNQKNTNAGLRATGQGKSSYSETVANQLGNQAATNLATNILPQYAQQAYQQRQDNIANQRNLYQDQNQQDFTNPISKSQVTGTLELPAEARAAWQQIIANKKAAESPTITREERAAISSDTDNLRSTLDALGIDTSGLGADKTAAEASTVNPGIRTLAGQQADETVKQNAIGNTQFDRQQNFNEGITTAGLTGYLNGKATTAEQQRQLTNLWAVADQTGTIPDSLADMYGIARGTQTQSAKQFASQLAISQQSANTSQASAQSGITGNTFNRYLDVWKATGAAPSGLEAYGVAQGDQWYEGAQAIEEGGLTANQVIDNVKALYQEPIYKTEIDIKTLKPVQVDTGKTKITSDPTQRQKMFDNVVDSGLSNKETLQALNSLGFTKDEIQKLYDAGVQSSGE